MPPKDVPIGRPTGPSFVAPTPQNTPLTKAPFQHVNPDIPDTIAEGDAEVDVLGVDKALNALDLGDGVSAEAPELPYAVRRRVEGLKGVQVEYMKLAKEYKKELLDLDRKYNTLYTPVFDRRKEIITGATEPTEQEIAAGEEQSLKDDPDAEPISSQLPTAEESDSPASAGIPQFWLTALQNHEEICELISERDEKALASLTDIKLEYLPSTRPGYKLHFHFSPNEFFTNEVLTKTYHYEDEVDYMGDYVYGSAQGTPIEWKEDQDLTKTIEVRKQRNKNTNRTRIIKRALQTPSFFDFFSPPSLPPPDSPEADAFTEEQIEALEDRLEVDYQVGEDLKDKVIPRAIDYFTGKILEYEGDSIMGGELDDEEGEGWDDDDESDGSNDVPLSARRQVTKDGGKTDAGECKNQ